MDCKWRRTRTDTNAFSHADVDANTFSHADGASTSYSSRTAASDTRTPPDTSLVTDLLPFY